jgi:multidrug transporter EmrE-like cation transporter
LWKKKKPKEDHLSDDPMRLSKSQPMRAYAALAASIVFSIAGQLLMKWAALHSTAPRAGWSAAATLALALFVYSIGVINWMMALRSVKLSVAYPLTSLNYVGIFLGSFYWFGEQISTLRMLGVLLIFAGVLLVVVEQRR